MCPEISSRWEWSLLLRVKGGLGALLGACERAAEWKMALNLLKAGGKVNAVMLNAAAGACQKGMAWRRGISMLTEPDRISRIVLATAFAEASQWQSALFCLDPDDLVVCNAVLKACEKASRWLEALALWRAAKGHVELDMDVVSFNSLIAACDQTAWRQALQVFEEMRSERLQADVTTLALLCSRCAGHMQHVSALLNAVEALCATSHPVLKME